MRPVRVKCDSCDLVVSGRFGLNEFAGLGEEDLHFLRIFVLCEGRIREMESAMGVSYPTIKARMGRLKETLAAAAKGSGMPAEADFAAGTTATGRGAASEIPDAASEARETATNLIKNFEAMTAAILKDLEAGRHTYTQAMEKLRQIQKDKTS
jgi:hypothetical protein